MWIKGFGNLGVVRSDKLADRHDITYDLARDLKLKRAVDVADDTAAHCIEVGIAVECEAPDVNTESEDE